jgi:hypothetical protein
MGKFPRKVKGYKIVETGDYLDEDELFDTEEEAKDALDSAYTIEETEMWQCVECDEKHEDRDDAYHCCE